MKSIWGLGCARLHSCSCTLLVGEQGRFSNRWGATRHTHMWVWLRFLYCNILLFLPPLHYARAALGLSHRSIKRGCDHPHHPPPPPPPHPPSGSSPALAIASRHHAFKSDAVPVHKLYPHSKIELPSQRGGLKGGVYIKGLYTPSEKRACN